MKKASDILRAEHDGILTALEVLEEICFLMRSDQDILIDDLVSIAEFIELWANQLHHGKEERFYYPALKDACGTSKSGGVLDLVDEHDEGRKFINELRSAAKDAHLDYDAFIEHAEHYVEHARRHLEAETVELFPIGDQYISPQDQERLIQDFANFDRDVIGTERLNELERLKEYFHHKYMENS